MSNIDYEYKFSLNGLSYYTAIVNGEKRYYKAYSEHFLSQISFEEFTKIENLLSIWDKHNKEITNE